MAPPEWIEHSTSPLPRARSTTELRRRTGDEFMPRGGGARKPPPTRAVADNDR